MEDLQANSETEEEYAAVEAEALAVIGAALLAQDSFGAKTNNKIAQNVYVKTVGIVVKNQEKLNQAAADDIVGSHVLDAIGNVRDAHEGDVKEEIALAEKVAAVDYGRWLNDARFINEGIPDGARKQYLKAARKAAHRVNVVGHEKAMSEAITELAQQGITAYTYTRKDGTTVNVPVDVGVRRALKSSDNKQSRIEQTLRVARKTTGLVEVSKTPNARKSHAKWQFEIYQVEGSSEKYRNFARSCKPRDPVDGIGGFNCGHEISVYHPAVGRKYKDPLEGTGYTTEQARDLTTKQRRYENDLRKLKREREVLKKLNLDTKDVNRRIRSKTKQLNDLIDNNSAILKRQVWNESIYQKARREVDALGDIFVNEKKIKKAADRKAYAVKIETIDTKRYKRKVNSIVGKGAGEKTHQTIRRMLVRRNGTTMEDLYAIDLSNGKTISSILNSPDEQRVKLTKKFKDDLKKAQEKGKKIALLHNHPGSSIPSASDLVSLSESGASLGIAACHNASIYTFKKTKEPDVGYNIDEESIDLVMTVWGDRDQDKLFAAIEERFGIRIEYYS